jgi:hypothetical protein
MTPHPLEFHGITPPPIGSKKTLCPKCSHARTKADQRCLSVYEVQGSGWECKCHHCGWAEWVPE